MADLVKIMSRVELFRDLNAEQLASIGDISQKEVFAQGTVICSQGDVGDKMYIIGDGQVEIVVTDKQGRKNSVVYLGSGQIVGEMALVDEGTRSASVVATDQETEIYSIPNDRFTELCRTNTDIGYIMMRNIAQDLSFKLRHVDANPSDS